MRIGRLRISLKPDTSIPQKLPGFRVKAFHIPGNYVQVEMTRRELLRFHRLSGLFPVYELPDRSLLIDVGDRIVYWSAREKRPIRRPERPRG